MNILQALVSQRLNHMNIGKRQLVLRIGYTNMSKGLRRIDNFMNTLSDPGNIRFKLQSALAIPHKEHQHAIDGVEALILKQAQYSFKSSAQVILSGRPGPIFAAAFFVNVDIPKGIASLSFAEEMKIVFDCYKQNQIAHFSNHNFYASSGSDYLSFVEAIEKVESSNNPIPWCFGKGFQYFRKYKDTLTFDRRGNLISRTEQHNKSSAKMSVNGKSIPVNFFNEIVLTNQKDLL
jgi:hypothetical protein